MVSQVDVGSLDTYLACSIIPLCTLYVFLVATRHAGRAAHAGVRDDITFPED